MTDYLSYQIIQNEDYVGDNFTEKSGLKNTNNVPEKLVIPLFSPSNGLVLYIGYNAFKGCQQIREVYIEARLKAIHKNAFCGCQNLVSINIPSTVTFLGQSALDGRVDDLYSQAHLVCYFDKNSKLNYINLAGISNYRRITLYVFDIIDVVCNGYFLGYNSKMSLHTIYSPFSFNICNISTTLIPQSFKKASTFNYHIIHLLILAFIV